jgi:hypothetical protein
MHKSKWKWSIEHPWLVVWMRSFPLGLTWVEAHSGLGIGSIVVTMGYKGNMTKGK